MSAMISRLSAAVVLLCCVFSVHCDYIDDGSGLNRASSSLNMQAAANTVALGDDTRLSRRTSDDGSLIYTSSKGGFKFMTVSFFFDTSNPSWQLEVFADDTSLLVLDGAVVSDTPTQVSPFSHIQ